MSPSLFPTDRLQVGHHALLKKKLSFTLCTPMVSILSLSRLMSRTMLRGLVPSSVACMIGCDHTTLNSCDQLWITPVLTGPVPSTTVASNSWVETSQKTLAKTSSVSKSSVLTSSSDLLPASRCIYYRTGCTMHMPGRTTGMFRDML